MKRTIISGPGYSAVTEDGKLMEFLREDPEDQSGMILLGRIDRLMPGMNCAFVDIGRRKNGFLPLDEESESFSGGRIRSGETLLLQIRKEENGDKGAFLTRDITLPGSLVILMPMNRYIGVSSRIKDEEIRERLKRHGRETANGRFGIVMRNAAAEAKPEDIREETERLFNIWLQILSEAKDGGKPGHLFRTDDTLTRLKEDYASGGYESVTETCGPGPEISRQLRQAAERTVRLPGGGDIVIDRCEAMTVIDVNTASSAGKESKERTVLETNMEACEVIAQQARLRNLGGIILVDFIDMDSETDQSLVLEKLETCFSYDRIKTVIHGWTRLGLMEMTRKRTGKEIRQERKKTMNRGEMVVPQEEMERQAGFARMVRELPHRPKSYHVVTYGCQMNAHDSEKIAGMLEEMGMTASEKREEADFVIFNTCCVRENAERRALGNVTWLKEIRRQNPDLVIAVCGCMIQEPGMAETILRRYRFVNLAFGTSNVHKLPEMLYETLNTGKQTVNVEDRDVIAEDLPIRRLRQDAAYLTIMYGCDNFCSYCIVPYVRGRERSRDPESILREAQQLADSGVKEIMLLGQNVNSYGKGLPGNPTFAGLLKRLDETGIPRIRFMTSHPKDLSDELIEVMSGGKHILPQFHLPVQSGNNEILKKMNRHYTREQYLDRVEKLRRAIPDIGLSTDIIVSFPGETEEQFEDTMSLVREVRFDSAFTFIYSPRTGTKAASMEGMIPDEISTERIQRLIALQENLQKESLSRFIGQEEEILVEGMSRRSGLAVSGKGRHGISVTVDGTEQDIGRILKCRISNLKNNTLTGERI